MLGLNFHVRPVSVVCLAAFRVEIRSPHLSFVPEALYQIDIMVVPVWGLYANMLAQLLSQVTSHFIIGYHRLVVFQAHKRVECQRKKEKSLATQAKVIEVESGYDFPGKDDDAASGATAAFSPSITRAQLQSQSVTSVSSASEDSESSNNYPLSQHCFTRPHRGESEKLVVKKGVNISLGLVALAAIVLTIVGCSLPSVSFDYQGIVGIAIESGQDFRQAKEYISVFSLTSLLMDQARLLGTAKDMVGMLSVSILLLFSTFFVPLALVAALLTEWFHSHRFTIRRRLRSTVEILQAWQYMEVLVLSLIVGAWQIGDVSELLLSRYCGNSLDSTLSKLASLGLIQPDDAKCFRVQAGIEAGAFVLVAAGTVITFLGSFVSMAVTQRTHDETRSELDKFWLRVPRDHTDDGTALMGKIDPVPVLFTDQFRWFLVAKGKI
jgi:hypothetical protein